MKGEITIDTMTNKYVAEYQSHKGKVLEHFIGAGKVIIRAKKHLKHGQIDTFYKECSLSSTKARELCFIASAESLNHRLSDDLEINGYAVPMPDKIDIDFADLRNVKTLENKINKGEATGQDLEDLLSGNRSYKDIMKRHKEIKSKVKALNEAENNTADFGNEPLDDTKPYLDGNGDIVEPETVSKEDIKDVADIFDAINKLKSKEEKVANLLHGRPIKIGRKTYIITEVK